MIIQLARLDMYADSLPGELKLSADEDTIKKTYSDFVADVESLTLSTIPGFLAGWDWQQLYNFLLRDGERQIATVEAAEMSGEKPANITQEDIDILMKRTDTRESRDTFLGIDKKLSSENAQFS